MPLRGCRAGPETKTKMGKPTDDPVESIILSALDDVGIDFTREGDVAHPDHRLDFHLPDFDIAIECKWDHSPRSNDQLSRRRNVILVQGLHSANFLADAIRGLFAKRAS